MTTMTTMEASCATASSAHGSSTARTARRGARVLGVVWLSVLALALVGVGLAWLAGWQLDRVDSRSMAPEIPAGSLAVVDAVRPESVRVGDVISFHDPGDRSRTLLHRVVDVVRREGGLFFVTKGDANATADPLAVPASDVRGELRWDIPRLGALAGDLRSPAGYLLLLGLPGGVLLVSEVTRRRHQAQTL